ncbi:MAG: nucleotidyltransferase domain-containing protein [Clostridia bacterium]|nr:nucleotidyltransferase domain-containing protein [Clostridia bacterium]
MTLKELRKQKKLTQAQCAEYLEIPLRTYQNYETDKHKSDSMKYEFMMQKLLGYGYIDEHSGVLTLDQIKETCIEVFADYDVEYCYLFGSYAKGKANEQSDVDLLVSANVSGMRFFELVEELREALKKKVDLLDINQLKDNPDLIHEILKDGVKIYG